jgi:hypothetical protein
VIAKITSITAEEIKPMFRSANVVTAASAGPANPERVITMNGVFFCLKLPISNKQHGHNFIMPFSLLDRFFSGIHPLCVEKLKLEFLTKHLSKTQG